jgi:hypothetical protein
MTNRYIIYSMPFLQRHVSDGRFKSAVMGRIRENPTMRLVITYYYSIRISFSIL